MIINLPSGKDERYSSSI